MNTNNTTRNMHIIFITIASHIPSQKNLNHFQRVYFLSRKADLTIWARKSAEFSASASARTKVLNAPLGGKAGLLLAAIFWAITGRARGADIVLTEPSLLSLTGILCKLFGAKRWVVDVWDVPGRIGPRRNGVVKLWLKLNRIMLKASFRFADHFLLSIRPDYEFAGFGVPREKLTLFQNAIWPDDLEKTRCSTGSRSDFNIFCMRSSYHADMGLDTLTQAYLSLRRRIENVSLTIVGHIPERLEAQTAELQALPNVEFIEFLEHGALLSRIATATVCVVPFKDVTDLAQTYPVKIIEYMALGKAIVASRIGGMSEQISDGETGLLFSADDPEDLVDKIMAIYNDRALASRLSENARSASVHFNCIAKGDRILNALREVGGSGGAAANVSN